MTIAAVDGGRWAVMDGPAAVGSARLWCVTAREYRIEIVVDAAYRGHGHGARLFDHVFAVARRDGARSVELRPSADDEHSIAFASRRGFVETMRIHHVELALADARHDAQLEVMDRLAREAVAIVTFGDFAARTKDAHAAYLDVVDAARDGMLDAPPTVVDGSTIVAEQRGRLVGFTSTRGTGVRPELRGRGIATALNVAAIDAAISRGETTIRTTCSHPAMRHITEKLGFRETACELRMVRLLES
jgi:GNAT superfamily N-acetyltransferase